MSGTLHFRDQLTVKGIEAVVNRHGFSSFEAAEKWIMDFEAYHLIQKFIPGCVIKGGMAVPFHLANDIPGRLSVDVDVVAPLNQADAEESMDKMFSRSTNIFMSGKLHKPQKPRKNLPLLTYFCKYKSRIDADKPEIKIDLFYSDHVHAATKKILPPSSVVGVDIDFEVDVYDYYPLIGDKLTTLAFDTIGVGATDPGVPKHVHDTASLVKSSGGSISISQVVQAFESSSKTEISYMKKSKHDLADIYANLAKFYRRLLRPSGNIGLNESYSGRFVTFGTLALGHSQRHPQMHATDVMMVSVLARALALVHENKASEAEAERIVNGMLSELDHIRGLSPADSVVKARKLRSKYKNSTVYDRIRTSPAEQVYLHNCLLDMDSF